MDLQKISQARQTLTRIVDLAGCSDLLILCGPALLSADEVSWQSPFRFQICLTLERERMLHAPLHSTLTHKIGARSQLIASLKRYCASCRHPSLLIAKGSAVAFAAFLHMSQSSERTGPALNGCYNNNSRPSSSASRRTASPH